MLFGPFPIHFIDRLRDKLSENGATCKVFSSEEAVAQFHEKVKSRGIQMYPNFDPQADLLYIEIDTKDLLIVKSELDRMGVVWSKAEFDAEFGQGEYLCPACDYCSASAGQCPKHQIPLLEFSEWAAIQKGRKEKLHNRIFGIFVVTMLLLAAWAIIKTKWLGG